MGPLGIPLFFSATLMIIKAHFFFFKVNGKEEEGGKNALKREKKSLCVCVCLGEGKKKSVGMVQTKNKMIFFLFAHSDFAEVVAKMNGSAVV